MAYRRRRVFKRKRKVSLYARRPPVRGYIRRAVSVALKRQIETKFRQYPFNAVGSSISGGSAIDFSAGFEYGANTQIAALTTIANGTGEGQRIGSQIKVRGIYIRFAVQPGDWYNGIRFIIFSPKKSVDSSSVTAMTQQVLSNVTSSGFQWLAPVDTENFKVYMDKTMVPRFVPTGDLTTPGGTNSVPVTRFVRKFIKLSKVIKWDVSAPVMPTNSIYLMAISDSVSSLNGDPKVVAGFVKLYYQDA